MGRGKHASGRREVSGSHADMLLLQLRETRVEVLCFLEKFLDRVSPRVKGWDQTYATDITVSPRLKGPCREIFTSGWIFNINEVLHLACGPPVATKGNAPNTSDTWQEFNVFPLIESFL